MSLYDIRNIIQEARKIVSAHSGKKPVKQALDRRPYI